MTRILRKLVIPALACTIALGVFAFQALPAFACGGPDRPKRGYSPLARRYAGGVAQRYRTLHDQLHVPGRRL